VLSSLVRLRRWRQALRLLPQRGANAAALALTSAAATAQPVGEIRKDGGDAYGSSHWQFPLKHD